MSFRGDLRKVISRAREQGFRVEKRKEYWLFFPPVGTGRPVRIGGTPHHKGRGWNNFMSDLKRLGYRE